MLVFLAHFDLEFIIEKFNGFVSLLLFLNFLKRREEDGVAYPGHSTRQ